MKNQKILTYLTFLKYIFSFFSLFIFFLVSCQKDNNVLATKELILPISQFPSSWEVSGNPKPMGSGIGFGDEDDFYANYKLKNNKHIISSQYVLYFSSLHQAKNEYSRLEGSEFNDNSIAISQAWERPREIEFSSNIADQYRVACAINNVAGEKQVCKVMIQYGQYIIIFTTIISPDIMTLEEFNSLIQFLDEFVIQKLEDAGLLIS